VQRCSSIITATLRWGGFAIAIGWMMPPPAQIHDGRYLVHAERWDGKRLPNTNVSALPVLGIPHGGQGSATSLGSGRPPSRCRSALAITPVQHEWKINEAIRWCSPFCR